MNFLIKDQLFKVLTVILLVVLSLETIAQEPPPRPIEVTLMQNLGFGAFAYGTGGGSVSVSPAGLRSKLNSIILLDLGISWSNALFRLTGNPGTLISLMSIPDVSLDRSGGGGTMVLHIGETDPVAPFVITTDPPAYMELKIGGTLTVSDSGSNPPGNYGGTFEITFIQE